MPRTNNVAALFLLEDNSGSSTEYDLFIAIPLSGMKVDNVGGVSHDGTKKETTITIDISSGAPVDPVYYKKIDINPSFSVNGWKIIVEVTDGTNTSTSTVEYGDAETDSSITVVASDKAIAVPYVQVEKNVNGRKTTYEPQLIIELDGQSFAGEGILFNEQLGVAETHIVLYTDSSASASRLDDDLRIHEHTYLDATTSTTGYFRAIVVLCSTLAEAAEYLMAMTQVGNANSSAASRPKKKTTIKNK